jgi:hypothetical protein
MTMQRVQILLESGQWKRLAELANIQGKSISLEIEFIPDDLRLRQAGLN